MTKGRVLSEKARSQSKKTRVCYEKNCSIGRTVAILSDSWVYLILRECYFGATRFDAFQSALGIPRATLVQRLRTMTSQALLRRIRYSASTVRYEYWLTAMGLDLYSVMLALINFGDKWLSGGGKPPLSLLHNSCGRACRPVVACSNCRTEVTAKTVAYRNGPGAGLTPILETKRNRRVSDPSILDRGRPSSVARALKVIGDRWSFMIIREGFFGVCRFDELRSKLRISPNILSDRLNRLISEGILERLQYQSCPDRFEYRFTSKGEDLHGPMLAMLRWGDRWLSGDKPPLILTHRDCSSDFQPSVICDQCREPLKAVDVSYQFNYSFPTQI